MTSNDTLNTILKALVVIDVIARLGAVALGLWLLARILGWIHDQKSRLLWVLAAGFLVTGIAAHFGIGQLQRKRSEARIRALAEDRQQQRAVAESAIDTPAPAIEAELKARAELVARWRAARRKAVDQWREKLVAANAVGKSDAVPPMLSVDDNGSLVTLTNRTQDPVCVMVARVATRDAAVLDRCIVGGSRCLVLQGGATVRWTTPRTGNPENCLTGALEYRIGDVDHPEPSWWSESALEAFGSEATDPDYFEHWGVDRLATELERLEQRISQGTRAH